MCYTLAAMDSLSSGASRLGLTLSAAQRDQFETYYRELTDWNRRANLTAITAYEEVLVNHFLDALTVALVWQPPSGTVQPPASGTVRVIEVGSGGGVPGVPLRIVFPEIRLTLLEATAKKTAFLRHLTERLGLDDVETVVGRAEQVAHDERFRETFDLVLARGVAPMPALAELTLPFAAAGGIVVAHKKGDIDEEIRQASSAIETMGGRLREVRAVELPEFADNRCLVVVEKVAATPAKYPRRPGVPARRPLVG